MILVGSCFFIGETCLNAESKEGTERSLKARVYTDILRIN